MKQILQQFGWLAIVLVAVPLSAVAANISWNDSAGGLFSDTANWNPSQVPVSGDNAVFGLDTGPTGYTVTFDGDATSDRLIVNTDVVTLDLGGFTYLLESTSSSSVGVTVGEVAGEVADLFLSNGTLDSHRSRIGDALNSIGVVTVDGAGSTWTNNSRLHIGGNGNGTLNITDGGVVNSNAFDFIGEQQGSTGLVTVDGAGSTWMNNSALRVGSSGSGTLHISNSGAVSNSEGIIGSNSSSTGVVTVDGAGSMWTNSSTLTVGNLGNGTLGITGGGAVSSSGGAIGSGAISTGLVTVDGAGSTWTNSSLTVGSSGSGTLNITDGGAISSGSSSIGGQQGSTGVVAVDGIGSTWMNSSFLRIGNFGSGTLNITGGGVVTNSSGNIGSELGSSGLVTVSGANSTWTNSSSLGVGSFGNGTLNISGGGTVSNSSGSFIGTDRDSTGVITVDGVDSMWTNSGTFYLGFFGSGTLSITNGGGVSSSGLVLVGAESGSTGMVTVDGTDSTWTNSSSLFVGDSGSGTLNITNGGTLSSSSGTIGTNSDSTGVVTVSGDGSTWTNNFSLTVARSGDGTLSITDGGAVHSGTVNNSAGSTIGSGIDSTGMVTVDGINSTWTNVSSLFVGNSGSGTLNITGGGTVSNKSGYISDESLSTGTVTVDGVGSTWTNTNDLFVGNSGSGVLSITSGGMVTAGKTTWVAKEVGSSGTIAFDNGTLTTKVLFAAADALTGTGTVNTNGLVSDVDLVFDATHGLNQTFTISNLPDQNVTVNLDVNGTNSMGAGHSSTGTMSISDGVSITSDYGYVGLKAGSTGTVTVDGIGSTWANTFHLYVGDSGSGTLNITDSGTVTVSRDTWVARGVGSSGTIAFDNGTLTTKGFFASFDDLVGTGTVNTKGLVSDVDLVFDSTHGLNQTFLVNELLGQNVTVNLNANSLGALGVGYQGVATMSISEGVVVASQDGYIGTKLGSSGTVTINGIGSTWSVNPSLFIGFGGNGTLDINDEGQVNNHNGVIGSQFGSTGLVTVDGVGSTWTSVASMSVGSFGSGTLNITDGGAVSNGSTGRIGNSSGSIGFVTVDSIGSTWTNSSLVVSTSGNGTLNITNGGVVNTSSESRIAINRDSIGLVAVNGIGSTWTSGTSLKVGIVGNGTLNITGGGEVISNTGFIGQGASSTSVVSVSGASSRLTLTDSLSVGNSGIPTGKINGTLTLINGGTVEATNSVQVLRTGAIRGSGSIISDVTNAGLVAPGFSPGIINITGDYTQTTTGTLEIEVGGLDNSDLLNPQFDQLIVSGAATLGGTTEFPIIDGFVPALNDEIIYLTAASVAGTPDALISPNLEQVNPNLGFQVIKTATDVRLRFVPKGALQFVDNTGGAVDATDWHESSNWNLSQVPESSDVIDLDRTETGLVQRVVVKNDDAFTHQFTLEDQSSPIELGVTSGHTLSSAVGDLTIGSNATIELNNGTLVSAQEIIVTNGGLLSGKGSLVGDVTVGVSGASFATGNSFATSAAVGDTSTLSPGLNGVGSLTVDGSYTQGTDGVFEIDISSDGNGEAEQDTLGVTDDVSLSGTLMIDSTVLTEADISAGDVFEIISTTEGTLSGKFDKVVLTPRDDVYFDVTYEESSANVTTLNMGDADQDGYVDETDAQIFATVLLNNNTLPLEGNFGGANYISVFDLEDSNGSDPNRVVDFFDIPKFAQQLIDFAPPSSSSMSLSQAYDTINSAILSASVPEPNTAVLVILGVLFGLRFRRPRWV